ncbi:alpha/beta hydrolase [Achromobacter denitrificans]|uniref:Alpha/beta hydrolase n=1 Tax=Achromobacter denitrificans TaxID=32002 RepID=A0A3R9H5J6_ACHDE|nr:MULTISPECIES: alpha/beta hydrolase [Achromobacter]ASC64181.1 alpha/beta hydrolase [Achromobacter denitrificans]MBV2157868.1 alpha/beta hydrolase [Achromobacter denitrificans]MDF3849130.1 alpha/beta hydrolase [Achromobacter denitrificans]MDF3858492.1 alpha/beta hydrolase [Achromobacter denitrificans]MDF3940144.1 alpha/beta hydrolase [Achromobacter denitrificans]
MATLYRNYDRAALDIQYNARATVPDIQPILKKYAEDSAEARRTLDCALDVPFGEHADESLDIFPAAAGARNAPVFVFIHGGYWRLLSKSDSSGMAPAFTRAGAVVVAVNYSLAPAVTLDRIVDQNRRALAWIHRHIAEYGGDPTRIHVCGSSAGGHLVGALLANGWHAGYEVPPDLIRGAAPLSGLFDLRPLVHTHINEWMRMSEADAIRNSPALQLPQAGCPLVVSYGETETAEFKRQSDDYLAAWIERGFPGRYVPMPGTNHYDIVLSLNDPDSPLTRAIFEQMGLAPAPHSR